MVINPGILDLYIFSHIANVFSICLIFSSFMLPFSFFFLLLLFLLIFLLLIFLLFEKLDVFCTCECSLSTSAALFFGIAFTMDLDMHFNCFEGFVGPRFLQLFSVSDSEVWLVSPVDGIGFSTFFASSVLIADLIQVSAIVFHPFVIYTLDHIRHTLFKSCSVFCFSSFVNCFDANSSSYKKWNVNS